ncbi:MAG: phosphate signaling complex protein PhoU [Actinomycetota bacterium]|nr:phosphate signaling complex protein PhoU [Actinomycetota bacterium]
MTTRISFQEAIGALRANVDWLGSLAEDAVRGAAAALLDSDQVRAEVVVMGDADIDELFVTLEQEAYHLIARQAPVAADLRFLVSALRVMADWERTGGLAVWVARLASEDWAREPGTMAILREMVDEALSLVAEARRAWWRKDLEVARALVRHDNALDDGYGRLTAHLLAQEGPAVNSLVMHALLAGRHIDRIADHAVAVGDRVVYMLTGKTASRAVVAG